MQKQTMTMTMTMTKISYFRPPDPMPTPLHYAASNGKDAVCRVLVEAGAKVDALDKVSWHCLWLGAVYGALNARD